MMKLLSLQATVLLVFLADCPQNCLGLQIIAPPTSTVPIRTVRCSMSTEKEEDIIVDAIPKAEYGISYIGGDPCGSKYNDDPFDTQVQKPGMPDDMKARIQALVDKKVAEEKALKEKESTES